MTIYDKCYDCLTNLIGISGCLPKPNCPHLIDSLGGISPEFLEAIANPTKQDGYMAVFNDAKKAALVLFELDVLNALGKYSTFSKEVIRTKKPKLITPLEVFTSNKTKWGVLTKFPENEHQLYSINSISFFPKTPGTVTIKTVNAITGVELYSETLNVISQYYNHSIDKKFIVDYNGEIVVTYIESADVEFYRLTCGNSIAGCGCMCNTNPDTFDSNVIEFDTLDQILTDTYNTIGYTPVCADITLECDIRQIICDYAEEFALAYMWKVYLQLIEYQFTTPQINYLAESNLIVLKEEILPMQRKTYHSLLNRTVKNLQSNLVENSICFDCMAESGGGFVIQSRA